MRSCEYSGVDFQLNSVGSLAKGALNGANVQGWQLASIHLKKYQSPSDGSCEDMNVICKIAVNTGNAKLEKRNARCGELRLSLSGRLTAEERAACQPA